MSAGMESKPQADTTKHFLLLASSTNSNSARSINSASRGYNLSPHADSSLDVHGDQHAPPMDYADSQRLLWAGTANPPLARPSLGYSPTLAYPSVYGSTLRSCASSPLQPFSRLSFKCSQNHSVLSLIFCASKNSWAFLERAWLRRIGLPHPHAHPHSTRILVVYEFTLCIHMLSVW